MASSNDKLNELLARGRMGGPARERALQRALRAARPPRRWRFAAGAATALAGAAALLLFLRVRPHDSFTAKGSARVLLEASCRTGARDQCPIGEKVLFRVDTAATDGYLAAYAMVPNSGERLWFFPAADGHSPHVAASPAPQLLPEGAALDSRLPLGEYEIHLLFSRRPLHREEVIGAPDGEVLARASLRMRVTR